MKIFLKRNSEAILLLILVLTVLGRFYQLSGGVVLGEPDEVTHQELVDSFRDSPWPQSSGGPWYYELPFFPFTAYLLSFVLPDRYLSLRVVSVVASSLLIFGIYLFLKKKVSVRAAFWGALIFSLSPFSIFYSRVGMLDATVVAFSTLSLIFFDLSRREGRISYSILAGLFLGLGILTKYSALVFLIVPILFFLFSSARKTLAVVRREGVLRLDLGSTIFLLTTFLVVLPVFITIFWHDRYLFKLHLLTNLGLLRDHWWAQSQSFGLIGNRDFLGNILWWTTWPVALLSLLGLLVLIRNFKSWYIFSSYIPIVVLGLFYKTPFYPRYFLLIIPFLSILSALLFEKIADQFTKKGHPRLFWFTAALFVFLILPTSYEAFRSSRHNLIEDSAAYVNSTVGAKNKDLWVFSTYWPNFYTFLIQGSKVGWLADSGWETSAFVDSQNLSSLEIIKNSPAVVLIEDLYSPDPKFKNPSSRLNARSQIQKGYSPIKIIEDNQPNFPHYRSAENKISIYVFSDDDTK